MAISEYNAVFYDHVLQTADASATAIVPIVMDLIKPSSVIDVGCGMGTWLSAFKSNSVPRIFGVDGAYGGTENLAIPKDCFKIMDLSTPFELPGQFDLAVCLEVAEHLPRSMSNLLVAQLTHSAPVVLFSAAIPGQRGTRHINEQWHEFWHERFDRNGFETFDILRPMLFANDRIAWWYRQNLFIYARKESPVSKMLEPLRSQSPMEVVASHVLLNQQSVTGLLKCLVTAFSRSIRNRIG